MKILKYSAVLALSLIFPFSAFCDDPVDPDPTGFTDPSDPSGFTDPLDPSGFTDPTDPGTSGEPVVCTFAELAEGLNEMAAFFGVPGPQINFSTDGINEGLDEFSDTLLRAAPQAAVSQNLWADAYIGKFFPALPPHFGFGVTAGGSKVDMRGLKKAADSLENSFKNVCTSLATGNSVEFGDIPERLILPVLSLDARIGGLILPFDVGFCLMMTSPSLFTIDFEDPDSILGMDGGINLGTLGFDGTVSYYTMGFDVRYAVLKGGLILPKISLGGGYIYTRGEFAVNASHADSEANINMAFSTHVLYLQAQVSKSFLIFTLFGGGRALLANTTTSYAWDVTTKYTMTAAGTPIADFIIKDGSAASKESNNKNEFYKEGKFDLNAVQPQVYLGMSLNLIVFQTSVSACCDVRSLLDPEKYNGRLWSGSVSFHFKI